MMGWKTCLHYSTKKGEQIGCFYLYNLQEIHYMGGPIYACEGVNGTMKKYIWKHTAKIETAAATLQNGAVRNTASTQSLL